jgi:predicted ATP-grasp superfamily ATP-dependent carboligase
MKGLGPLAEGRSLRVLVFEYVTGGGLAGRELPASWATEGAAMRRAIVDDFAAVPWVRVLTTLDARLPFEARSGVGVRIIPDREGRSLESLAAEVDYTVLIAPETDGILADLTLAIGRAGGRSLGSEPEAIALTADKERLAAHFQSSGIPTPPTRPVRPAHGLPTDWEGPILVKPVDGAGSIDTFVVRDPRRPPPGLRRLARGLAQPYLPGAPRSASYLVDREGRPTLLAVGRQRIEVDDGGCVRYRGGIIGEAYRAGLSEVDRAVHSVPGLRGFVGVDFLDDPRGGITVLEINPRPTTSYVGLARLLPPGTVAGAWLAAASRELEGTDWPERLRLDQRFPPVIFDADGSIRSDPNRMDDPS